MKLVIDTDPGIHDAMAITFAALHPPIERVGLTSIFGNVTTAQATRNAIRLVERLGLTLPVAEGARRHAFFRPSPRPSPSMARKASAMR